MSRRFRTRLAGVAIVSACGFTATTTGGDGGATDDSVIVDAPPDVFIPAECLAAGTTCVGPDQRLRACSGIGAPPVDTVCAWRCVNDPAPHCRTLQPAGGAVTAADMEPSAELGNIKISSPVPISFNTDNGAITILGVPAPQANVRFEVRDGVAIWRANNVELEGVIEFRGANPAAIVSITEIQVRGLINLQGECLGTDAGPGGGRGGDNAQTGVGNGGGGSGSGTDASCSGGGGGGHAALGGSGGNNRPAGPVFGTQTIVDLDGGGGGGGGGGPGGGDGAGGGGALQLVANVKVRVDGLGVGGIHAGGCGGKSGSCGGGGGAGGTILIEASVVEILNGAFTVNGGGGGGGKSGTSGTAAHNSQVRASGGPGATNGPGDDGGDGGDGGDESAFPGEAGANATRAGGGGGAVGRIRFHTMLGTVMTQGVTLSPNLSTPAAPTSVSAGSASLQ